MRVRVGRAAYVLTVAVLAACGFGSGSTALILLAFALTLPTGAVALIGYYAVYGFLALLPGHETSTGDLAPWFAATTTALGVLAPVVAALVDVALLTLVLRRRRRLPVDDDSRPDVPAC